MPKQRGAVSRVDWQNQYDELERRRSQLLVRLDAATRLCGDAKLRRTALQLVNQKFRAARLHERVSILASAEWAVNLLETTTHSPTV